MITAVLLALSLAAAANVRPVLLELKAELETVAGERIDIQFGATGTLARQIQNGAPFDLFLAADEASVASLAKEGHLEAATVRCYAVGALAVVAASDAGFALPAKLDRQTAPAFSALPFRRLALASPKLAPYGRAAEEVLRTAGIEDSVRARVVHAENVDQALTFVSSGNAEIGIVSLSEALRTSLSRAPVDPSLYAPIRQFAATVTGSSHREAARRVLNALTGKAARPVWERSGYSVP